MKVGLGVTSIDGITLGDKERQAERAPSRRSARAARLDARHLASSERDVLYRAAGAVYRVIDSFYPADGKVRSSGAPAPRSLMPPSTGTTTAQGRSMSPAKPSVVCANLHYLQ
jgi:hypothetical protein